MVVEDTVVRSKPVGTTKWSTLATEEVLSRSLDPERSTRLYLVDDSFVEEVRHFMRYSRRASPLAVKLEG
jgi:hypothetical protein